MRYKGTGTIHIRYVSSPSANKYRSIGIGRYVEITADSTMTVISLDLKIRYDEDVEHRLDESKLRMYYWDERDDEWKLIKDSGVDTRNNYVYAHVDHLTIFSAFQYEMMESMQKVPPALAGAILVVMATAIIISLTLIYMRVSRGEKSIR